MLDDVGGMCWLFDVGCSAFVVVWLQLVRDFYKKGVVARGSAGVWLCLLYLQPVVSPMVVVCCQKKPQQ